MSAFLCTVQSGVATAQGEQYARMFLYRRPPTCGQSRQDGRANAGALFSDFALSAPRDVGQEGLPTYPCRRPWDFLRNPIKALFMENKMENKHRRWIPPR